MGGLLAGVAFVAVIVVWNAGYVYREKCPDASGHVSTSWTYQINDIIPYVGHSKSGCDVHTSTRLILSGIGVWPLRSGNKEAGSNGTVYAVALGKLMSQASKLSNAESSRIKALRQANAITPADVTNEEQVVGE